MKTKILFSGFLLWVTLLISCSSSNNNAPAANPGTNDVFMQYLAFVPASKTISVGTTITWTNRDNTTHTVTSNTGVFSSSNIAPNGTFSFKFITAGTYPYHCTIHPTMTGTITVQ